MGQPVAVTVTQTADPGRVRLELNRSLTGQEHEYYDATPAHETTFGAVLAGRLFATGCVLKVHVLSNMVTIDVVPGCDTSALAAIVTDLYQYWKPGMVPVVPTA